MGLSRVTGAREVQEDKPNQAMRMPPSSDKYYKIK
jgi:hypothetical protein